VREAYRLERIAKAPQHPAAWLTQGIAFHDAIEKWERSGRAHGPEYVDLWYCEAWDNTLAEQKAQEPELKFWITGGRTKAEDDIERRFHRGRQQVKDYIEWANATAHEWRVLDLAVDEYACEIGFDMILDGTRIVGFIDQIIEWRDGKISLRDLKTGNKLPSSGRQLGVYRIAALETVGLDIQWGDYFMSKNTAPTKPYDLSRYTHERVGKWFKDLDASVESGVFIPNPGDACNICSVSRFCDLLGDRADEYPIGGTH
jgi:CRISPR/Cas system-associated exonuclease Cas4 (RecB family)